MKKKLSCFPLTLQQKIMIGNITLILGAVVVLGIYFSLSCLRMLRNNTMSTLDKTGIQIRSTLNQNLDMLDNALYSCFHTDNIQKWAEGKTTLHSENYVTINNIRSELSFVFMFDQAWNSGLISTVYLIIDETPVSTLSGYQNMPPGDYEKIHAHYLKSPHSPLFAVPDQPQDKIYYIKTFHNNKMTDEISFLVELRREAFFASLQELPAGITGCLSLADGSILYRTQGLPDADRAESIHRPLKKRNYTMSIYIPDTWFYRWIVPTMRSYLLMVLLILAVFITLSAVISSKLTRFLADINGRLLAFQNRNYRTHMPAYQESDLNLISNTFNHMADEIRRLITTVYEEQVLVKDRELKLLQAQMNPHFLVNSLTTIGTIALENEDMEGYQMITALTKLLDGTLLGSSLHSPFIPLHKEMEYTKCYLYLQKIRFHNRLSYSHSIPDKLQDCYIPALTIEPLVENAVVHGIEKNTSKTLIQISAEQLGERLIITIADNGAGFDTSILDHLSPGTNGHHISITNIRQRIINWFGADFGIDCKSSPGKGTTVTVFLPVLKQCPEVEYGNCTNYDCRR